MGRYGKSAIKNNDHKVAGFALGAWMKWRNFLRKHKLIPRRR